MHFFKVPIHAQKKVVFNVLVSSRKKHQLLVISSWTQNVNWTYIRRYETLAQMFFCEFYEIFANIFLQNISRRLLLYFSKIFDCFWKIFLHVFFFISNVFFNSASVLLNFSWFELQILLSSCLIDIDIFILRYILHLVYLCMCLGLRLFMLYVCDLFFIFSLIFNLI